MKRCWFGLGLLLFLLITGLLVTRSIARRTEPIANELTAAANNALVGNWDTAQSLTESAADQWQKNRPFTAAFADHSPMEEIEGDLAQLKVYIQSREKTAFAALAMQAAKRVQAVGEAHGLAWQNVL